MGILMAKKHKKIVESLVIVHQVHRGAARGGAVSQNTALHYSDALIRFSKVLHHYTLKEVCFDRSMNCYKT